jgi:hypothetical protein
VLLIELFICGCQRGVGALTLARLLLAMWVGVFALLHFAVV